MCIRMRACDMYGDQRTTSVIRLSPTTIWVLESKVRSLDLQPAPLPHLTRPTGRLFKWHLGTPENMSHLSGYGLVFQVWETKFTVK